MLTLLLCHAIVKKPQSRISNSARIRPVESGALTAPRDAWTRRIGLSLRFNLKEDHAMKTQKTGLLALLLAALMALSACGGKAGGPSPAPGDPAKTTSAPAVDAVKQVNEVTVYTAITEDEAAAILGRFEEETGVKVNWVRLSSGELYARVQAEAANPQASVWYISAVETLTNAAREDLLEPYASQNIDGVPAYMRDPDSYYTPAIRSIVGILSNDDFLAENGLETPDSFDDLLDPAYKGQIVSAHPATSGAAYAWLNTIVLKYGEEAGFDYLKQYKENVYQWTKGGGAPGNMVKIGEAGACTSFAHDAYMAIKEGYPLTYTVPEDSGYELAGVAMIKNGPAEEREAAQKLIDWTISQSAQQFWTDEFFRFPVVDSVTIPNYIEGVADAKLMEMDLAWAADNRTRILERFEDEIHSSSDVVS